MITRRSILAGAGGTVGVLGGGIAPAWASASPVGRIALLNLHTGERCDVVYREGSACVAGAMAQVNKVLRDHRTGEVHAIEPRLLDLLGVLAGRLDFAGPFHVISGYRSPASNAKLHAASSGVATKSLHMQGMAMDIRAPGRPLTAVRDTALAMKAGGVGFYPASDFVHVDVGRVRQW